MTKRADVEKPWKPSKRTGYCDPRCGGGHTRLEYLRARAAARRLCDALGRGWTPRVWDNMGWHIEAVHELAHLTVKDDHHGATFKAADNSRRYWCTTRDVAGLPQFHAHAATPGNAVVAVLVKWEHVANLYAAALGGVKDIVRRAAEQ